MDNSQNQNLLHIKTETVSGLNIRSQGLHRNELTVLLKNFQKAMSSYLTEKWIIENDDLVQYNVPGFQPVEYKSRTVFKRRS